MCDFLLVRESGRKSKEGKEREIREAREEGDYAVKRAEKRVGLH